MAQIGITYNEMKWNKERVFLESERSAINDNDGSSNVMWKLSSSSLHQDSKIQMLSRIVNIDLLDIL